MIFLFEGRKGEVENVNNRIQMGNSVVIRGHFIAWNVEVVELVEILKLSRNC